MLYTNNNNKILRHLNPMSIIKIRYITKVVFTLYPKWQNNLRFKYLFMSDCKIPEEEIKQKKINRKQSNKREIRIFNF